MLSRAGVPRYAIIRKLAGQEAETLEDFMRVLQGLQKGSTGAHRVPSPTRTATGLPQCSCWWTGTSGTPAADLHPRGHHRAVARHLCV